jgi:hypothetical protein
MFGYFMERVRNGLIIVHVLAPVLWFQAALLMTGLYARYTAAQEGKALEETPFFSGQTAVERLGAVSRSGSEDAAYLFYLMDSANALLVAAGLASLVAFGLRALRVGAMTARAALMVTLSTGLFDLAENVLLTAALASYGEARATIGALAGFASGMKFTSFLAAALLATLGLCVGATVWLRRSLRT